MNNGPCDTGSSCQATVNWEANPVGYRAFVADGGEAFNLVEDNADASSNLVTIPSTGGSGGPQPWSVSLMVSPTLLPVGKSVTVVAAANQSVAGTPYEVEVFSLNTGKRVGACGESNGCTFTMPWDPRTQLFVAFVATPSCRRHRMRWRRRTW